MANIQGKRSHKGRNRRFTAPEELKKQLSQPENDVSTPDNVPPTTTSSKNDESEETAANHQPGYKGVESLIQIRNINRDIKGDHERPNKKELAAAQRAAADPLTEAELSTEMARLALVRKEREQAALARQREKEAREAQKAAAQQHAADRLQALREKNRRPGKSKKKPVSESTTSTTNPAPASSTTPSTS